MTAEPCPTCPHPPSCAEYGSCQLGNTPTAEPTPRWVSVHSVDEMEAFYKAILTQIRTEAKYHGYAIGLHGSMRRDLDLIAIPWSDDHSDKDELARAIQEAACGMPQMVYQWNNKPCGRVSVSIPVCWPEWPEGIGDGHIDLSVMPDLERELSLSQSRLAEVQKAGREFLTRYDLLEPDLSEVFTFYAVHGMKWPEDRNWKSELEALREAIKRSSR